jgi:hypothetical protein
METNPEFPDADTPDPSTTDPDDPRDIALADNTDTSPDPDDKLDPLYSTTEPPMPFERDLPPAIDSVPPE